MKKPKIDKTSVQKVYWLPQAKNEGGQGAFFRVKDLLFYESIIYKGIVYMLLVFYDRINMIQGLACLFKEICSGNLWIWILNTWQHKQLSCLVVVWLYWIGRSWVWFLKTLKWYILRLSLVCVFNSTS